MPIVRTFAPVVAGVGRMEYRSFLFYNVFGGVGWVCSMLLLGYVLTPVLDPALKPLLGSDFEVRKHVEKIIIIVVLLSISPGIVHWVRAKQKARAKFLAEGGQLREWELGDLGVLLKQVPIWVWVVGTIGLLCASAAAGGVGYHVWSRAPKRVIVGTWKADESDSVWEFAANGDFIVSEAGTFRQGGYYKLIDKDKIAFESRSPAAGQSDQTTGTLTIDDKDTIHITGAENVPSTFRRVTSK
jgi:hypothetical protein